MRPVAALVLLCAAFAAGKAWAEAVVLSSTAPGMAVGRVIRDGEAIHLPEDTQTALLLATGQVLKLAGPYDGLAAPSHAAGNTGSLLAGWSGTDLSALGGARGELVPPIGLAQAGEPVAVESGQSGTWCVAPAGRIVLKRPPAGRLELEDARSHRRVAMAWPDGAAERPWPAELPLGDETTVLVRGPAGEPPYPIRLRVINERPGSTPVDRLLTLASAGCLRQAGPALQALGMRLQEFALYLSTDRGRTPRYAVGEPVTLVLQTNRPADLYCWVLHEAGASLLFPPPGRLTIPDHSEIRIPGERVAVQIAASPPPGLGEVRCYAVPQGTAVTAPSLPAAAQPEQIAQTLDAAFASLPRQSVARARVIMRVE
jgi:hypothetical protein